MPKTVKLVMREAAGRSWKHLADERIEGTEQTIPLGKRFWALTKDERAAVEAIFAEEKLRRLATSLRSRRDEAPLAGHGRRLSAQGMQFIRAAKDRCLGRDWIRETPSGIALMDVKEEAIGPSAPHSNCGRHARRITRSGL